LSTHASQRCFRSLLEATANPGKLVALDEPAALAAGAAVVALALADIDTPVAIAGDDELAAAVSEATRAPLVPVSEASLVALLQPTAELVGQCRAGPAETPERGAKVGLACRRLMTKTEQEPVTAGSLKAGPGGQPPSVELRLQGPGVDGRRRVVVDGIDRAVFDAVAKVNAGFPGGLDAWLIDRDGQVLGLPRSTTIAVA
jgi:alpha-D-ribose 1-methylphosphonate 5-triphosphate synthase subunit PhnH